jgi:ribosomal protein S10
MRCFVAGVIYGWQYVFLEKNARVFFLGYFRGMSSDLFKRMEREIREEINTKQSLGTIQQRMIKKYKLETENYYKDIDKRVDDLVNDTDKLLEYINILHDRRDIEFKKGAEYFSNKIDVLIDTYTKFKSVKREFLETQADVIFNIVMNIWDKDNGDPKKMKFLGSATRQGQTYLHVIALSSTLNTQLDELTTDLTEVEDYIMKKLKGSLPLRMYLHNKKRNKAKEEERRKAKEEEEEAHRKAKEEEAQRKAKEEAQRKEKEEASAEPQRKSNPVTQFFRNLCYGPGCSRRGGARRSIHKKLTHNRMATRKKRSLKKGTKRRQRGGIISISKQDKY